MTIGNAHNLEYLDLSGNKLTGKLLVNHDSVMGTVIGLNLSSHNKTLPPPHSLYRHSDENIEIMASFLLEKGKTIKELNLSGNSGLTHETLEPLRHCRIQIILCFGMASNPVAQQLIDEWELKRREFYATTLVGEPVKSAIETRIARRLAERAAGPTDAENPT
jgi:hypothetical protein